MKLLYRTKTPKPDDPEIIARIAEAVRKGHQPRAVAAYAGISRRTLDNWQALGLAERDAEPPGAEGYAPGSHVPLVLVIEEAYLAFEAESLGTLAEHKRKGGGWAPILGHLGHMNRADWGQHSEVRVEAQATHTLRLELPPGAAEPLLALLRERLPGAKAQGLIEAQSTEVTDAG